MISIVPSSEYTSILLSFDINSFISFKVYPSRSILFPKALTEEEFKNNIDEIKKRTIIKKAFFKFFCFILTLSTLIYYL